LGAFCPMDSTNNSSGSDNFKQSPVADVNAVPAVSFPPIESSQFNTPPVIPPLGSATPSAPNPAPASTATGQVAPNPPEITFPSVITTAKKKTKVKSVIIPTILGLLVLTAGVAAGLILVRQNQNIQEKAATGGGVATVRIDPTTTSVSTGQSFTAKVWLNSGGRALSAADVFLNYTFSGTSPFLEVTDVTENPQLTAVNWTFPVKRAVISGSSVQIEISASTLAGGGYVTPGEILLATITFQGDAAGSATLSFDSAQSKVTEKSTGADILLTPTATANYAVTAAATPTPTVSPTEAPTATPTGNDIVTATPVSTSSAIPETGISWPTVLSAGIGVLLLSVPIAALVL
jgi:hypothetical protein